MNTCVDDLFNQIINSEEKAQEKKNIINEVKVQNSLYAKKLKEAENDLKTYQGQIVVKVQKLNEAKLQLRWANSKASQMNQQRDSLKKTQQYLTNTLKSVEKRLEERRQQFCDEAWEFAEHYDLCNIAARQSEARANHQLQELQEQHQQLEQELCVLAGCKQQVVAARYQLTAQKARLHKKQQQRQDLERQLTKEREELSKFEQDRHDVQNTPDSNHEFKRLKQELEQSGDDSLQMVCTALQQELNQLRRMEKQQKQQRSKLTKTQVTKSDTTDGGVSMGSASQTQWTMWTRNRSKQVST